MRTTAAADNFDDMIVPMSEELAKEAFTHTEAHNQRSTIHSTPSKDGAEFFGKHIPVQNPIVHAMHIFQKILVIFRMSKIRNSHTKIGPT